MLTCRPRKDQPCFLYQGPKDVDRLNEFLRVNDGSDCRIKDGKAEIITTIKGKDIAEQRTVYLYAGSWLRCFGKGQFTAVPGRVFQKEYELV